MGLQLRFVIDDVVAQGEPLGRLFAASLLVLLVVIAVRPGADPTEQEATNKQLTGAITVLRKRMLSDRRTALIAERDAGTLDDEVLRELLEQLDHEQAATSTGAAARL